MSWDVRDYLGRKVSINLKNTLKTDLVEYGPETTFRELLQNADDARATRVAVHLLGSSPDLPVIVALCNDAEFAVNDERDDVGRFLDFHSRGKERERGELIGRFGIGRVACYHLSDEPLVVTHVNRESWMLLPLDVDQKRGAEHYQGPEAIPDIQPGLEWVQQWPTTYWLKVRAGETRIGSELGVRPLTPQVWRSMKATLQVARLCEFLLFLNHLTCIEVFEQGQLVTRVEKTVRPGPAGALPADVETRICSFRSLEGPLQEYLVFEDSSPPDEKPEDEDTRTWRRKLAFEWRESAPVALEVGRLFCYLPTSIKTGFPFHVHASFHVKMDRERLVPEQSSQEWNHQLLRLLGNLFLAVLPSLRQLVEGRCSELYSLFPLDPAPGADDALHALTETIWDRARLRSEPLLLDQNGAFLPHQEIWKAEPELYPLFAQSDQPFVSEEIIRRFPEWLEHYEQVAGALDPFDGRQAVEWLSGTITPGMRLDDLARDPASAGCVLTGRGAWIEFLAALRSLEFDPSGLRGRSLALTTDGCLRAFDPATLRSADSRTRKQLAIWDEHLGTRLDARERISALLLDEEAQELLGEWLHPVALGRADLDFVLRQLRRLVTGHTPSAIKAVFARVGKNPVEGAVKLLKFLLSLSKTLTADNLRGLYLLDQAGEPLLAGTLQFCNGRHLSSFFSRQAVPVLHKELVQVLRSEPSSAQACSEWTSRRLLEVEPRFLPQTGRPPDPELEPPFQTAERVGQFLAHLYEVWDEGSEQIGELSIFLAEDGLFRPLVLDGQALMLPSESELRSQELNRLNELFPSPALAHSALRSDKARRLLSEKLAVPRLDAWNYLCSTVVPALSDHLGQPESLVELADILRRIFVLKQWNKVDGRADELSRLPWLLTSNSQLLEPRQVYEPTPEVVEILGGDVPSLHPAYSKTGSAAERKDRLQFLKDKAGLRFKVEPEDLIKLAERLAQGGVVSAATQDAAARILRHLGTLQADKAKEALRPLAKIAWLAVDRKAAGSLAPGRLHPPELLYSPHHAPLVWTQHPCAFPGDTEVEPGVYELAGLKDDPPAELVTKHMKELRRRISAGEEKHQPDYDACLEYLGEHYKPDPLLLAGEPLFPTSPPGRSWPSASSCLKAPESSSVNSQAPSSGNRARAIDWPGSSAWSESRDPTSMSTFWPNFPLATAIRNLMRSTINSIEMP